VSCAAVIGRRRRTVFGGGGIQGTRANDSVAIVAFVALWKLCRCEGDGLGECDIMGRSTMFQKCRVADLKELELRELRRRSFGSVVVMGHTITTR
jgi:hypothetical protein